MNITTLIATLESNVTRDSKIALDWRNEIKAENRQPNKDERGALARIEGQIERNKTSLAEAREVQREDERIDALNALPGTPTNAAGNPARRGSETRVGDASALYGTAVSTAHEWRGQDGERAEVHRDEPFASGASF